MEFIATHRLVIPQYGLPEGTLLRQVNPFAQDQLLLKSKADWEDGRSPWIFGSEDVEPLSNWMEERAAMITRLENREKPNP